MCSLKAYTGSNWRNGWKQNAKAKSEEGAIGLHDLIFADRLALCAFFGKIANL